MTAEHSPADRDTDNPEVKKLRRLAHLLDSSIRLPGGYRIGLDGIIGLIPFVGDALGASLSSYIVIRAAKMGVSTRVLLAMIANIIVETVIGVIPILGDIFDFAWKANERNIRLLNQQLPTMKARSTSAKRRLTAAVLILITLLIVTLALLLVGAIKLFTMLLNVLAT